MTHFAWISPAWFWTLVLVAGAVGLAVRAETWRRRALAKFAEEPTRGFLTAEVDRHRRRAKMVLLAFALGFAVLALAGPTWDAAEREVAKGRDIVVLLDVSRSMYAGDLRPSRLAFAKRGIEQFASHLRGDRIALVAFAGSAALRCPLTTDMDFFRLALDGASPESVTVGGTEIAKAIRAAVAEGFDDLDERARHIVLITDAEDHGAAAAAAAAEGARKGIRLHAVGLGDEVQGARVPESEETGARFISYRGSEVWSKLNVSAIRDVAQAGSGNAVVVGSRNETDLGLALDNVLLEGKGRARVPRVYGFWIPLGLAVVCLGVGIGLSDRRKL